MKAKHTVLLVALGFALEFIGGLLKITHRPSANSVLLTATVCKVLGVLLLAWKVVRYEGFRKFMER